MTVLIGLSGASKLVDRLAAQTEVCDCQHPHATAEYGGQIIGWPADNNLGRQHVQCVVQDMVYTTGGDMECQNRSSVTQRQMDPQIQQELAPQSWRGVQAMASSLMSAVCSGLLHIIRCCNWWRQRRGVEDNAAAGVTITKPQETMKRSNLTSAHQLLIAAHGRGGGNWAESLVWLHHNG